MDKLFIFMVLGVLNVLTVYAANDSSKVCTITINSDNEANLFKKYLSSGENKGKFEFVELTKGTEDDWFSKACEKKIPCDVLVISGHFSGGFFSDKNNLSLSLDELEDKSCNNKCDDILTRPTEVFLFGCNTLASKDADQTTADAALRRYLAHGMTLEQAVRSAQNLWGAFGNSNRDTMKRIFKGVRNIYGFSESAPLGNTIEPRLKKYFEKVKDYGKHLLEIETKRAVDGLAKTNSWISDNNFLADTLKDTYFYQCSGLLADSDDPILKNICAIKDEKKDVDEKLDLIERLLVGTDSLVYAPTIIDFFDKNSPKNYYENTLEIFKNIQKNESAKANFKAGWSTLAPVSQISYLDFMVKMGWMDVSEATKIEKAVVTKMLTPPISTFNKDSLCGYYEKFEDSSVRKPFYRLSYDDISSKILNDKNGVFALGCIGIKDKRLVLDLEKKYLKYKNLTLEEKFGYFKAIAATEYESQLLDDFILKNVGSKNKENFGVAIYLAELNRSQNARIQNIIIGLDRAEYNLAYGLHKMKISDRQVLDKILARALAGELDFFVALMPFKEKLDGEQIEKIRLYFLGMKKEELGKVNELVFTSLPAKIRAEVLLSMLEKNVENFGSDCFIDYTQVSTEDKLEFKKQFSNYLEKMSPSDYLSKIPKLMILYPNEARLTNAEIRAFIEIFKISPKVNYKMIELMKKNIIEEEFLNDIFMIENKNFSDYDKEEILKNNIRKGSKIPQLLINKAKTDSYSQRMIEILIEYEKIDPSVEGQMWLVSLFRTSENIRQFFKEVGFLNEEIEKLYNQRYKD